VHSSRRQRRRDAETWRSEQPGRRAGGKTAPAARCAPWGAS